MGNRIFVHSPYKVGVGYRGETPVDSVTLHTVKAGTEQTIGFGHKRRTVVLDRHIAVFVDGVKVGEASYRLRSRSRKAPGQRYASARWQTPGWGYAFAAPGESFLSARDLEAGSMKACVEQLVEMHLERICGAAGQAR